MAKKTKKKTMGLQDILENYAGDAEAFDELNKCLIRFCQENILTLKTLAREVDDSTAIDERILHFVLISKILSDVSSLSEGTAEEEFREKKTKGEPFSKKKKQAKKKKE